MREPVSGGLPAGEVFAVVKGYPAFFLGRNQRREGDEYDKKQFLHGWCLLEFNDLQIAPAYLEGTTLFADAVHLQANEALGVALKFLLMR